MKKSALIVIEGLDGCGKTTQVKRLVEYINYAHNIPSKELANVSDGIIGKAIRTIIGDAKLYAGRLQSACLFIAEMFHISKSIKPEYDLGTVFVCSRHYYSTLVYGTTSFKQVAAVKEICSELPIAPDMVVYLDTSIATVKTRMANRNNSKEVFEDTSKQHYYLDRYNELMTPENMAFGEKVVTVNGNLSEDEVFAAISAAVDKYLTEHII